jgi:hypothetical protein
VSGAWYVYAIWAALAVFFASMWMSFGAGLARSFRAFLRPRAVASFAAANGWSYQARGWRPLRPGPPYLSGTGAAACTHMVSGTSRGEVFAAFDYAHQAQVVSLKLPMALPLVDVRPHGLADLAQLAIPSVSLARSSTAGSLSALNIPSLPRTPSILA